MAQEDESVGRVVYWLTEKDRSRKLAADLRKSSRRIAELADQYGSEPIPDFSEPGTGGQEGDGQIKSILARNKEALGQDGFEGFEKAFSEQEDAKSRYSEDYGYFPWRRVLIVVFLGVLLIAFFWHRSHTNQKEILADIDRFVELSQAMGINPYEPVDGLSFDPERTRIANRLRDKDVVAIGRQKDGGYGHYLVVDRVPSQSAHDKKGLGLLLLKIIGGFGLLFTLPLGLIAFFASI